MVFGPIRGSTYEEFRFGEIEAMKHRINLVQYENAHKRRCVVRLIKWRGEPL